MISSCTLPENGPVWSDEFNYEGVPDSEKWSLIIGNGCPDLCGFGNNELQYYTSNDENVFVEDGRLVIRAVQFEEPERRYTSAKLVSKEKGDWTYGTIEARAKLPTGRGTWAAIWMMPSIEDVRWPNDGEIDIMEHVGYQEGWVHGAIHTENFNGMIGNQVVDSVFVDNAIDDFHVYSLEWDKESIVWKVDGNVFNEFEKNGQQEDAWPFDKPFHLILNIAVGGNWGAKYGIDDSIWPQEMEIDYIRVYQ